MPVFEGNQTEVTDLVESPSKGSVVLQKASAIARARLIRKMVELGYFEPYITVASPFAQFAISGTPTGTNPLSFTMTGGGITLTCQMSLIDNGNSTTVRLAVTPDTTFTPGKAGMRFVALNHFAGRKYKWNGGSEATISKTLPNATTNVVADGSFTSLEFTSAAPYRFLLTPGSGTYNAGIRFEGIQFEVRIGKDDNVSWTSGVQRVIDIVISDSDPVGAAVDGVYAADGGRDLWAPYTFATTVTPGSFLDQSGDRQDYDPESFLTIENGQFKIGSDIYVGVGGNITFSAAMPASQSEANDLADILKYVYGFDHVRLNNHDGLYSAQQGPYVSSGGVTTGLDATGITRFGYFLNAIWSRGIRLVMDCYSSRQLLQGEVQAYVDAGGTWTGKTFAEKSRLAKRLALVVDDVDNNFWEAFYNLVRYDFPTIGPLILHPMLIGLCMYNEPIPPGNNSSIKWDRTDSALNTIYDAAMGETVAMPGSEAAFVAAYQARGERWRQRLALQGYGSDRYFALMNWGGSGAQLEATDETQNAEEMHEYAQVSVGADAPGTSFHGTKKRWGARYALGTIRLRKGKPAHLSECNHAYHSDARHEWGFLQGGFCAKQGYSMVSIFDVFSNRTQIPSIPAPVAGTLEIHRDPVLRESAAIIRALMGTGGVALASGAKTIQATAASDGSYVDADMDTWPYKVLRSSPSAGDVVNTGNSSAPSPYTGDADFGVSLGSGEAFADCDRVCGYSGPAGGSWSGDVMAVNLDDPATVVLTTRDGKDFGQSRLMHLRHLSRALWNAASYTSFDRQALTSVGSGNPVLYAATASVVLTLSQPSLWRVFRVRSDGSIGTEVSCTRDSSTLTIPLQAKHGGEGWIHYKLIRSGTAASKLLSRCRLMRLFRRH